jgi:hypothetical protein
VKVEATIEEVDLENEDGNTQEGVCATCSRCDHTTESFGTSEASVKRCLLLLREECPNGERNFYVGEE